MLGRNNASSKSEPGYGDMLAVNILKPEKLLTWNRETFQSNLILTSSLREINITCWLYRYF